jgi:leucyl-tRNA synthetase
MGKKYDHKKLEKKWQTIWEKKKVYKTLDNSKKKKFYILDMFPYVSGEGIHVGHPKGYIATDVVSRMKRMQGFNVLHPMGFDAFGLPAENYAIKTKTDPTVSVLKNIDRFKKQLKVIGFDYDWSREVNTSDPKFYKWTQWIFLKLLEKGLAYESNEPVNWCPKDKTILANEDVEEGKCERCGTMVEKRPIRQWVLKITDYADKLIEDLSATEYNRPKIIDKVNLHQPGKPIIERQVAHAIVFDPKKKKYLIIRNKKFGWDTVVMGGIKNEETPADAARREVMEETGYVDIEMKRVLGGQTEAHYYTNHKNENRIAYATAVYFELKSEKKLTIADGEHPDNEILWVTEADFVPGKIVNSELPIWLERIKDPKKGWPKPLLDWPESIKESQRNWIGRSEGVNFKCKVKDLGIVVEMYNSVPQTFRAETFTVIAPEHLLVPTLVAGTKYEKPVLDFVEKLKLKRSRKNFDAEKEMEGIFTGRYIENFAGSGRDLPIWVASYVVADYGTGIVNASAHDTRDFAFAKKYNIPLRPVMFPKDKAEAEKVKNNEYAYVKDPHGILVEPIEFKGREWGEVREDIINYIVKNDWGDRKVNYKLRDWVFSRQRYWGEPIPVLRDGDNIIPVKEKDLPIKLPKVKSYKPTGRAESPLADVPNWINVKVGKKVLKRESNTMPQWAGSSWYYLRYMDPNNNKALVDKKKEKYWNVVDLYVGGAEHATRHLIYARFWHKFLYDIGVVTDKEPFKRLQHVGLIIAKDGRKMSKRFGNIVNPDDIISTFGADTLRVYEMFMGPFDQSVAWSDEAIIGPRRFLERVWKLREKVILGHAIPSKNEMHRVIKKVSEDIEKMNFNTAVSALMIYSNVLEKHGDITQEEYDSLLKLLSPFAPHMTEELWQTLGHKKTIHLEPWPVFDEAKIKLDEVTIVVQVNGKVRGQFKAPADINEAEATNKAEQLPEIQKWIAGRERRFIFIPRKIVNIVV